jgi:5-methylcytosine-specific restriction endonuclease McrA
MDKKQDFLRLVCIEMKKYDAIADELQVSRAELTTWWDELREEREKIAALRRWYQSKKFDNYSFMQFYEWYQYQKKSCAYCGITEATIEKLISNKKITTKRLVTRGRRLELDRQQPNLSYNERNNLVLCCYWCNNAKTDEFTTDEFMLIAQGIRNAWQKRLEQIPVE